MKWKWFMFDTDLSFDEYDLNNIRNYFSSVNIDNGTGKVFASRLIANETFRNKFLQRLAWQINNVWTENNIYSRIEELSQYISVDLAKDAQRWNVNYAKWEGYVDVLRTFAAKRSAHVCKFVQDYFNLSTQEMHEYGFNV